MADIIEWPLCVLRPQTITPCPVAFTRSGGASLGGVEPAIRTDIGHWTIQYGNVVMQNRNREQWQTWQAIRQKLSGRAGLIVVPVRAGLSAPFVSGKFEPRPETFHSGGASFDDGSEYTQSAVSVVSEGNTALGATVIKLRIINAAPNLAGVMFSFNHALYETGPAIAIDGDVWTVPISPSVREFIPSDSVLEFDQPTCLCRLTEDRGMDLDHNAVGKSSMPSVQFIEATDYWNALATGAI